MKKILSIFFGLILVASSFVCLYVYSASEGFVPNVLIQVPIQKKLGMKNVGIKSRLGMALFDCFPSLLEGSSRHFLEDKKSDAIQRMLVITNLGNTDIKWVPAVLIELLREDDYSNRIEAYRALSVLKSKQAIPELLKRWNQKENDAESLEIARTIIIIGRTEISGTFEPSLKRDSFKEGLASAALFELSTDKKYKIHLQSLLKNGSHEAKAAAVLLLGEFKDNRTLTMLSEIRNDRNPKIRTLIEEDLERNAAPSRPYQ